MLDQELARLKRVSSTRFGEFAQVPLMIVLSQCCFSICLYQSRGFGLLAWEIKTWCWVGQETGVYLLVDISCWRGNFLQGGENEHIFGWLPPSPSPPPTIVWKGVSFFIPLPSGYLPMFTNMQHLSPTFWHPSRENTRFHDTPESRRLITCKTCVSPDIYPGHIQYILNTECVLDRNNTNNQHSYWHWM